MMFLGYDRKFNAYILEKEVTTDVPIGGSFFPYWNLKTDNYGKLILPFLPKLMIGTKLEFEISADEQKKLVKVNFNKFDVKFLNGILTFQVFYLAKKLKRFWRYFVKILL